MTYQQIIKQRSDLKEEMEERVSIMMIDGNMNLSDAENKTAGLMHEKYIIIKQGELL